jgi:hypothetical protein
MDEELRTWACKILAWNRDTYVYFFNDFGGYATKNAARLERDIRIESGSERIPRGLIRVKRANGDHYYSLRIEDYPLFTAQSFN